MGSPGRIRCAAAGALLALSLGWPGAGRAAAEETSAIWSVRPTPTQGQQQRPNFDYALDPGQRVDDSLRIRNFGRTRLPLRLQAADARTTETGALDLLASGQPSTGVGAWVSLERTEVDLAPGEVLDVGFSLTVPQGARSGDYVGGVVTALGGAGGGDGPVRVERRLGNLVHLRVAGALRPRLEISAVAVDWRGTANPLGRGEVRVAYTVRNAGNVRLAAQQAVRVRGPLGLDGRRLFLDPLPAMLPGDARTVRARVPGVVASVRTGVEVELRPLPVRSGDEFGAETAVVRRSTGAWTVPWVLLALLAALVAAPAAAICWWRRAAPRPPGGPDTADAPPGELRPGETTG